jgi:hypothetical protein
MGRRPADVRSSRPLKEGGRYVVPTRSVAAIMYPRVLAYITQMSDFSKVFSGFRQQAQGNWGGRRKGRTSRGARL